MDKVSKNTSYIFMALYLALTACIGAFCHDHTNYIFWGLDIFPICAILLLFLFSAVFKKKKIGRVLKILSCVLFTFYLVKFNFSLSALDYVSGDLPVRMIDPILLQFGISCFISVGLVLSFSEPTAISHAKVHIKQPGKAVLVILSLIFMLICLISAVLSALLLISRTVSGAQINVFLHISVISVFVIYLFMSILLTVFSLKSAKKKTVKNCSRILCIMYTASIILISVLDQINRCMELSSYGSYSVSVYHQELILYLLCFLCTVLCVSEHSDPEVT